MEGDLFMLTDKEESFLSDIYIEEAWAHVEYLSTLDKTSGTGGERRAHEYVRSKLKEYGVPYETYEFDSLISHPKEAQIKVVSPTTLEVECITHAFSASTPEEGIEAELVHVPSSPSSLFTGVEGLVEEYRKVGVDGKVSIIWGVASPAVVWAAQQAGALAQVHICGGDVRHEMIVTTVWGTPTPESAGRIPRIAAVSVKHSDGEKLLGLLEEGPVRVNFRARTDMRWRRIPFTVAEVKGSEEPEKFMLVHGHMDSWYLGTTDNCTGNAALLELARLLQKHQDELKKSVRIAWWSGHSTGRYSASTWYADNLFHDLDRNCFLSMNIDSPGVKGATELGGGGLMGTMDFVNRAAKDATGVEEIEKQAYYMRAGDQSFYGIGVPSVAVRAYIPEGSPHKGKWIGGSGGAWWWHSAYDTLDKGDRENLLRDMRMEALAILRSMNSAVMPFDFAQVAEMYESVVKEIQTQTAPGTIDMNPVLDGIRELKSRSEALNYAMASLRELSVGDVSELNDLLIRASRVLTSTFYTYAGRYDQDPAYGMPQLPGLQRARELVKMDPDSDEARFMWTRIVREANRVNGEICYAAWLIDKAIEASSGN
ncbi:MAG: M28 family peptidase [Candidatus Bathyarchaeota archaeon]|nr:M28 family peptidase [Candidatus Bathyarchaeota archaeon]